MKCLGLKEATTRFHAALLAPATGHALRPLSPFYDSLFSLSFQHNGKYASPRSLLAVLTMHTRARQHGAGPLCAACQLTRHALHCAHYSTELPSTSSNM